MNYDVFFYEAFAEEEQALREFIPADLRAEFTWKTIQEYDRPVPPAKLISIRTQSVIPPDWAGQLQAVLSRSTGYDHLVAWRRQTGSAAACGYLPLYSHRAVAEQAMLLWMALLRKLPLQMVQFNKFQRDGLTGNEVEGKNLLVVGVGNIGYETVKIGRGLGMHVRGVDIVPKHDDVHYGPVDELIGWADVIVCAMNLTTVNRGYFSRELLQAARQGVIFVNISRGELSPPCVLLELTATGHLGGVGLDVYEEESALAVALRSGRAPDAAAARDIMALAGYDNVVMTPHNAFNTHEAVIRKSEQSVRQITAWRANGAFEWPVPDDADAS